MKYCHYYPPCAIVTKMEGTTISFWQRTDLFYFLNGKSMPMSEAKQKRVKTFITEYLKKKHPK